MLQNTTNERVFLNMIGAILSNRKPESLPEGVTQEEIYLLGRKSGMTVITFSALKKVGTIPNNEEWENRQNKLLNECVRSGIMISEYKRLVDILCARGIRIIPLKGIVMKGLYPDPDFRGMSDVDLLYEGTSSEDLSQYMEELGYTTMSLDHVNHDVFHKKPCMSVELHRQLMAETDPYKKILENEFENSIPDSEQVNLYHLKKEDFYLHVIAHAAKHFKKNQAQLKHMCDIYILNRTYASEWDREYIDEKLKLVGLSVYEKKLRHLASAFFGEELMEVEEDMILWFFGKGSYSILPRGHKLEIQKMKNKTKLGRVLRRIFLPASIMRNRYKGLRERPFLLPFYHIYRWFLLLSGILSGKKEMTNFEVSEDVHKTYYQLLNDFGL